MNKLAQVSNLIWYHSQIVVGQVKNPEPEKYKLHPTDMSYLCSEKKERGSSARQLSERLSSSKDAAFLNTDGGTLAREWRLKSCWLELDLTQGSRTEDIALKSKTLAYLKYSRMYETDKPLKFAFQNSDTYQHILEFLWLGAG